MTVGVGVVGLSATRGWARTAHLPALRAIPGYELRALTASSPESARASAEAHGVAHACASAEELAARDDVDLVVVTVRVPEHAELVAAAVAAGKMVLCEWPLGVDTAEAETMASAAADAGVGAWAGLQARSASAVGFVRDLIADDAIGEVLSTTLSGTGMRWGATVDPHVEYLLDAANGGTLLTIPFGHAVDALAWCLGEPDVTAAIVETRRAEVRHTASGERLPMTAPDEVAVLGRLPNGAVMNVRYRGGTSAGQNFRWEIVGSQGELVITGEIGHLQYGQVQVFRAADGAILERLDVPERYALVAVDGASPAATVANAYAGILDELRGGPPTVPTFADAVERHRMLDRVVAAARRGSAATTAG